MTLIVEDGSLVADANTYIDVDYLRAYCDLRGITLPDDDDEVSVFIIKGMDYIETQLYKGSQVSINTQWPRENVELYGFDIDSDVIPKQLKDAQCQASVESNNGVDLMPTTTGKNVIREKVGPIETEYSESNQAGRPVLAKVNKLLAPLLLHGGQFRVIRV